ncbi:MAG: carbohydrate ABC transporter permease [Agromyces sp.]
MAAVPTAAGTPVRRRPRGPRRPLWAYALLVLAGLLFAIPLFWLLSSSLKTNAEIYSWPLQWLPSTPNLANFTRAWESAPFDSFFVNSIVVTIAGTLGKVVLAVSTAYAFAFLRFPGKNILFLFMIGALMVPGHVTLLVNYITISNLGLINTYAGIILPGLASAFGTFLLRQHFLSLPGEVMEAASIDGAGHVRRLVSFVVPMSRPAVVTVALIAVIDEWNSFVWPLIATNSLDMRTLPIGLMFLKDAEGINDWGVIMAGTVFVVLPMLLVFLFAQKYIITGLAGAAIRK